MQGAGRAQGRGAASAKAPPLRALGPCVRCPAVLCAATAAVREAGGTWRAGQPASRSVVVRGRRGKRRRRLPGKPPRGAHVPGSPRSAPTHAATPWRRPPTDAVVAAGAGRAHGEARQEEQRRGGRRPACALHSRHSRPAPGVPPAPVSTVSRPTRTGEQGGEPDGHSRLCGAGRRGVGVSAPVCAVP